MRRKAVLVLAALAAWVAGAALGAPGRTALASPFILKVGKAHPAEFLPAYTTNRPIFVLALGSDARAGEPIARARSDSIHIIGIDTKRRRASILGFPRDSWVEIPGHGNDKINSAMTFGGPKLTIKTVEKLTGIHIDYYVLTSFKGVKAAFNSVGGVTVDVPYPMHDPYSKADFDPGKQHMTGPEALAFARDRHDVPGGDIGRSENQGRLLIAALAEYKKQFRADPSEVLTWLGAGLRNIQTDIPLDRLLGLAFTAEQVDPKNVTNQVVPAAGGTVGGAAVVFIQPSAKAIYNDMKADGLIGSAGGKGKKKSGKG